MLIVWYVPYTIHMPPMSELTIRLKPRLTIGLIIRVRMRAQLTSDRAAPTVNKKKIVIIAAAVR